MILIKQILIQEKERAKAENRPHTYREIGEATGLSLHTVASFFRSSEGSLNIADKLLQFFNIQLVRIESFNNLNNSICEVKEKNAAIKKIKEGKKKINRIVCK